VTGELAAAEGSGGYGFHPDLGSAGTDHGVASLRTRVHHIRASDVVSGTAQTAGVRRFAAISGPHREENPDPDHPAVIVIARSTQEAIVVNLPGLYALSDAREEPID
jgi:hypothetical protein